MIDWALAIREYLHNDPRLTPLAGDRVWPGVDLPPTYAPAQGPALLFNLRGVGLPYETYHVLRVSIQFRAYAESDVLALALDRVLFDALAEARSAAIKGAYCEVPGQPLAEADSGWPFVLSFYTFLFGT